MTQRPLEPAEVPSAAPVAPGRSVRVPALASLVLAVVFALLGFLGAVTMTDLAGALVLGGGLLAGAAALPRVGRVLVPAAVITTVGVVGLLQAVVANRGGGGLLIAATAVAVLTWLVAVVAALMDAGVLGSRAPRPAAATPVSVPVPAPAPPWAPVEGWQPSAYPADPTMTYVGGQPTGQQALAGRAAGGQPEPAPDPTAVFGGVGQPAQAGAPAYAAAFGQSPQVGGPEPTTVFGGVGQSAQAGGPEPTTVFGGVGQSPQAGGPEPTTVFGQSAQAGGPEPTTVFGQSAQAGGPEPTAVFGQLPQESASEQAAVSGQPQGGAPEATSARSQPGAPAHGPAPTGVHRTPTQVGGVPLFGAPDAPSFAGQAPTGAEPASPYGLVGSGQAATSAHHQPVQDTSAFGRGPDGDLPLFGVAGVRQTTSAHHEPVQDASAYDGPRYGGGSTERGQDAGAGRGPTGAHRAPAQDGVSLFGAPPTGQPGRNGAPPPAASGYGLFGAGAPGPAPTGAHRAPSEADAASNGRSGPTAVRGAPNAGGDAVAPSYGTNGATAGGPDEAATRGVNGTPRDSAVPSQRAGTEASGPSYQQAGGARSPYGRAASAGRELPTRGRRSAEQRPADQGGDDADPSPETTAFPVQHAPTANPTPAWGQPPPSGQGPDAAGPPGPRRAARDRRPGNAGEARHGQPDPERPDATQVFPQPER